MTPAAINHVTPLSNRVLVELLDRAEREERQLRHHTRSEERLDLHQQIEALRLEKHRRLDSLRAPLAALG